MEVLNFLLIPRASSTAVSELTAPNFSTVSELTPEQITENIFEDLGSQIQEIARTKAPVKSGALRDSITYTVENATLTLDAAVDYATYQEFGTGSRGEFPGKPYKIRPKKPGGKLVFKVKGKTVFAKEVTHPGVRPQPFLRPAVMEAMGPLLDKLADKGQAMIVKGPRSTL